MEKEGRTKVYSEKKKVNNHRVKSLEPQCSGEGALGWEHCPRVKSLEPQYSGEGALGWDPCPRVKSHEPQRSGEGALGWEPCPSSPAS